MQTESEHLLACLAEEAVEIAQRCTKALRFSLAECQPGQPFTNAERIMQEVQDLRGVLRMLDQRGIVDITYDERAITKKIAKVEEHMTLARCEGALEPVK